MANEDPYNTSNSDNYAYQDGSANNYGTCAIGKNTILGNFKGMIRFPSIPIAQGTTVNYAVLYFYASNVGSGGSLNVKWHGVDEDNTAILTGDPFGRPDTTAFTTVHDTRPNQGAYEDYIVTDIVNEILGRAGWASGNAMAFKCYEDGSDTNVWISDPASGAETYLLIRVSAEPNFFPTPGSIAVPTFPVIGHQGLKISKPGIDVLKATESQLLLTTRKKELKIIVEGNTDCTSGVEKLIAHGQPSAPAHLAYVESGGYRLKLNRDFLGATNPIAGSAQGYVGADATNVRIIIDQNKNVYYYIFMDPLSES
jgi:hypothetical protein